MSIVDRLFRRSEEELPQDSETLEEDLNDLFTALSNSRRRFIIDILADKDDEEWVDVGEFAEGIAFTENDHCDTISDVRGEERKRVYIALIQGHMEALSDSSLLVYDKNSKRARKTAGTMAAQRLMHEGYREVSGGMRWFR